MKFLSTAFKHSYVARQTVLLFDLVLATTTKDFRQRSFIEWNLKEKFHQEATNVPYQTDLHMLFRTRQRSAFLFMAQNQQKSKHLILEVSHQTWNIDLQKLFMCYLTNYAVTGWQYR